MSKHYIAAASADLRWATWKPASGGRSTVQISRNCLRAGGDMAEADKVWWLYLLACADGRTYAGIALDVTARFRLHAAGKASKFTRANRPLRILGAQPFADRSQALR